MEDFRLDNAVSFAEATKRLAQKVELIYPKTHADCVLSETVTLSEAVGRHLAEDVIANHNVPNHRNAAVDGFGLVDADIASANMGEYFAVSHSVMAGDAESPSCPPGKLVAIMTGAIVPSNINCIVMNEEAERGQGSDAGYVRLQEGFQLSLNGSKARNIRDVGEDISKGNVVFYRGRRLSPADIGVLASLKISQVSVKPRLRVAYFSTGNEIKPVDSTEIRQGEVIDSNGALLQAMLQRLGCIPISLGIVKDDERALEDAFTSAIQQADIVITSGGVSMGDADYIRKIFNEIGEVDFWKLAIKPGRPFAFGHLKNSLLFGLPGNPTAVMTTFYQLVMPVIVRIQTEEDYRPLLLTGVAAHDFKSLEGRYEFVRGLYTVEADGQLSLSLAGKQGSGILTSMSTGNCYIHLDDMQGNLPKGASIKFQPFFSFT